MGKDYCETWTKIVKKTKSDGGENSNCTICYINHSDVAIEPCGHCFCEECALKLNICEIGAGSVYELIK